MPFCCTCLADPDKLRCCIHPSHGLNVRGALFCSKSKSWHTRCGSGQAREAGDAMDGTGYAGVRGHARSHRLREFLL
ncbi:protein of unknown function [Pseudomonas sp. JV551A1]|uniref:Uncharacterized protein n=1 Tax=Pseudomonas inefficax TaxID=2078786 RepID=A0AAQ1SS08_9PSED|nr:protein of unknown function [Pseudomonas sp. JV551A1]SPO58987.1 protein of unknown function [Pseudomonas inefficax]